jgi:hypothetical protein
MSLSSAPVLFCVEHAATQALSKRPLKQYTEFMYEAVALMRERERHGSQNCIGIFLCTYINE